MADFAINKSMDREDLRLPGCQAVLAELFGLMRRMQRAGVSHSSWYGTLDAWPSPWEWINRGPDYAPWPDNPDEVRIPWFLLWEIAWLIANTPMRRGSRVLDMGGAASLFSCYLASRGHDVVSIDLNPALVAHSDRIAAAMNWRLAARSMDMQDLDFPDQHFDHVFSICVFEHLPISGRVQCSSSVQRVLKPGGTAAFTFDYANPQAFARIDTPHDVEEQLIAPTGLTPRGNMPFLDAGKRYLDAPTHFGFGRLTALVSRLNAWLKGQLDSRKMADRHRRYTFGAVFLEKPLDSAQHGSHNSMGRMIEK